MSRSGRETLPDFCVVRRSSRMSRSGREAFQMSRGGQKSLPDAWEWLGVPPG